MRWTGLLAVTGAVFATASVAAAEDPIRVKLDKAKAAYDAEAKRLRGAMVAALDRKEAAARNTGDKKLVDQVKDEREQFLAKGTLPKVIPTTEYQRAQRQATAALESAYKLAVKEYLLAKKDDDAEAVGQEWEALRPKLDVATEKPSGPLQVWIGRADLPVKLEIDTIDGTDFTGSWYGLFADGTVKHHDHVKGKIEKGIISFTRTELIKDGGLKPAKLVGRISGTRIEGTWELLNGGLKGTFTLELERKKK